MKKKNMERGRRDTNRGYKKEREERMVQERGENGGEGKGERRRKKEKGRVST